MCKCFTKNNTYQQANINKLKQGRQLALSYGNWQGLIGH